MALLTPVEVLAQILNSPESDMRIANIKENLNRKKTLLLYSILAQKSANIGRVINPNEVEKIDTFLFEDYYLHGVVIMRLCKKQITDFLSEKTTDLNNLI